MQNNFFCVKRALTDGDLKQFETEYNIAMPLKIREHYLKYNGGYPERNVFCSVEDEWIYCFNNNDGIISRWDRTEKTHLIKSNNFERYILDEMVDAKDEWD